VAPQDKDQEMNQDGFEHDDPIVDEALEWFARLRNTTPDTATQAAFDLWIATSPLHAQHYRDLEEMWGASAFKKAVQSLPTTPAPRLEVKTKTFGWTRRFAAMAAAAVLAIGIWQYPALMLRWQADYLTTVGDRSTVTLPDGSLMTLNTASAVAFDFADGKRNIRLLQGEAFFDVKPDAAHPFRVAANYGEVEVKGTAFSVRHDDDADRVVLEHGLVEVRRAGNHTEKAYLRPGEMIFASGASLSTVSQADLSTALAWRDGRLIFEDQPFSRVLRELRRYYRGTVVVVDKRHDQLTVTGNYRLDNVETAIQTLADAAGVSMTRLPGGIIILR
jgi:transmembrane sensor